MVKDAVTVAFVEVTRKIHIVRADELVAEVDQTELDSVGKGPLLFGSSFCGDCLLLRDDAVPGRTRVHAVGVEAAHHVGDDRIAAVERQLARHGHGAEQEVEPIACCEGLEVLRNCFSVYQPNLPMRPFFSCLSGQS